MNKELASYFFEEASRTFVPVVKPYGFADPVLECDDTIHFAFVTFLGRNLAIECVLDEREEDIACEIARVVNGKKATYMDALDGIDDRGVRVRERLSAMVCRNGVRERLFTKVSHLELRERIPITLRDFALMLERYGRAVLDDSPKAFD